MDFIKSSRMPTFCQQKTVYNLHNLSISNLEGGLLDRNDRLEVEPVLGESAGLVEAEQLELAAHVDPGRGDAVD